jgi:hypothetical protein
LGARVLFITGRGKKGYHQEPVRQFQFVILTFILVLTVQAQSKPTAALSCPETIKVSEAAIAPAPWKSAAAQSDHAFERVSIYNGTPGAKEYDLAPDDEKNTAGKIVQTWNVKDYRSMNVFLRCRYHDTAATLFMDVPAAYTNCTLSFTVDKKGNFLGKSTILCR